MEWGGTSSAEALWEDQAGTAHVWDSPDRFMRTYDSPSRSRSRSRGSRRVQSARRRRSASSASATRRRTGSTGDLGFNSPAASHRFAVQTYELSPAHSPSLQRRPRSASRARDMALTSPSASPTKTGYSHSRATIFPRAQRMTIFTAASSDKTGPVQMAHTPRIGQHEVVSTMSSPTSVILAQSTREVYKRLNGTKTPSMDSPGPAAYSWDPDSVAGFRCSRRVTIGRARRGLGSRNKTTRTPGPAAYSTNKGRRHSYSASMGRAVRETYLDKVAKSVTPSHSYGGDGASLLKRSPSCTFGTSSRFR